MRSTTLRSKRDSVCSRLEDDPFGLYGERNLIANAFTVGINDASLLNWLRRRVTRVRSVQRKDP
jgi:hypothetical protein